MTIKLFRRIDFLSFYFIYKNTPCIIKFLKTSTSRVWHAHMMFSVWTHLCTILDAAQEVVRLRFKIMAAVHVKISLFVALLTLFYRETQGFCEADYNCPGLQVCCNKGDVFKSKCRDHRQPKNRFRKLYINDWAYTRLNPLWFNARDIVVIT